MTDEMHGTVDLRIPSNPKWVAVARLAVVAIANRLPFSVEELEDLKLAIAEACTNVIQHAADSETIDITVESSADKIVMRVRDSGFTPSPAASEEEPPTTPAGDTLGIFLIQALMDDVTYVVDPHAGSELVMTKRVGS